MEINEEIFNRIESYLQDEMSPEERLRFEAEMADRPELQSLVDKQQLQLDAIELMMEKDLRGQMQAWKAKAPQVERQGSPARRIRLFYQVGIAAAIALAVVASFWIFSSGPSSGAGTVVAEERDAFNIALFNGEDEGFGIAGSKEVIDSIQVLIFESEEYRFHYRFKENLQLFITPGYDFNNLQISIDHLPSKDQYILSLKGKKYALDRGFNDIYELKSTD